MIYGEDIACRKCAWFSTVMGQNYCYKHKRVINFLSNETCCVHFVDSNEYLKETKEESEEATKTDSVCDIRLKCYRYGKINGVCSEDLNDDSTEYVSINSKKVLYKTEVKEFRLPLSNSRTGKRYFLVVLTDDVKLYCPESEFNKV